MSCFAILKSTSGLDVGMEMGVCGGGSVGVGVSVGGSGVGTGGTGMPVGKGVAVAIATSAGVPALVGVKVGLSVLVGVGVGWERARALHPIPTRVKKTYPTKIFRNIKFASSWNG
jgi:hypothetical protein